MENKSKKQIVNDYRKAKKINKSKIRDGKRQKEFLLDDSSILNSLPSGAFDKSHQKNKIKEDNNEIPQIIDQDEETKLLNENYQNDDEEEEYEKFDDDYFKQETI
jgi:hypothetical protein